jgi:hypothetical protein
LQEEQKGKEQNAFEHCALMRKKEDEHLRHAPFPSQ